MIANLLHTIILAVGIATGNVSSNSYKGGNAFNYVEKQERPTIKRAVENVNETYYFNEVGRINYVSTYNYTAFKSVLTNDNDNPNYMSDYMLIQNTSYNQVVRGSTWVSGKDITVIQITNYYNSSLRFTMQLQEELEINYNYSLIRRVFYPTTNVDNYINLTLTQGMFSQINDWTMQMRNDGTPFDYSSITYQPNQQVNIIDTSSSQLIINARDTLAIVFETETEIYTSSSAIISFTARSLNIQGSAQIPEINYEVVNIPNLMFTILTMPFSFISTAFNLTVFPGTPYAINFGNLIYTIIAAFILLYIIKKIFK